MEKIAVFVMSPGRCGTQWLADLLKGKVPEYSVAHEPIHFDYNPLKNSPTTPLASNEPKLLQHLAFIQQQIKNGINYIECGFPAWRHLDWFRKELKCNVKVIYIHRDPIENAASLLKLNAFVPPVLPHLPVKAFFHPASPDALLPEYSSYWENMQAFEKCLYYWAEVNLQAIAYQKDWTQDSWLTIPFSELFTTLSLQKIQRFIEREFKISNNDFNKLDQFDSAPQAPVLNQVLTQHEKIYSVAKKLGYEYL